MFSNGFPAPNLTPKRQNVVLKSAQNRLTDGKIRYSEQIVNFDTGAAGQVRPNKQNFSTVHSPEILLVGPRAAVEKTRQQAVCK